MGALGCYGGSPAASRIVLGGAFAFSGGSTGGLGYSLGSPGVLLGCLGGLRDRPRGNKATFMWRFRIRQDRIR